MRSVMDRQTGKQLIRWAFLAAALIAGLFAGGLMSPALASEADHVPGQVVVRLNPASGASIQDINATYGTSTLRSGGASGIYLLATPDDQTAPEVVAAMAGDLRLLFAELNYIGEAPEADPSSVWAWGGFDDEPYHQQYADDALSITEAQTISRGAGTIVAVIDTGVQLDHPVLVGSLTVARLDLIDSDRVPEDTYDEIDNDGDGVADEAAGHGTHVSGIILRVAPEAQIMPIRALDSEGRGNAFTLAAAIQYATNHGADVINLSLGMEDEADVIRTAIRYATQRGTVVVAAAGNFGIDEEQHPAATQCALAVTSVGPDGVKSGFSNYGGWITVSTPGESIYSTFLKGGYAWWSGTSMATPFVAGQSALLLSQDPTLDPREVNEYIAGTTYSLEDANPGLDDDDLGAGHADFQASLLQLLTGTPPDVSGNFVMSGSCVE